jgi:hypothetical protein
MKPEHYKGKIEPIDLIEAQELGFHEGNVVKYVSRWRRKNGLEDLLKCKWYLERLIKIAEIEQYMEDTAEYYLSLQKEEQ